MKSPPLGRKESRKGHSDITKRWRNNFRSSWKLFNCLGDNNNNDPVNYKRKSAIAFKAHKQIAFNHRACYLSGHKTSWAAVVSGLGASDREPQKLKRQAARPHTLGPSPASFRARPSPCFRHEQLPQGPAQRHLAEFRAPTQRAARTRLGPRSSRTTWLLSSVPASQVLCHLHGPQIKRDLRWPSHPRPLGAQPCGCQTILPSHLIISLPAPHFPPLSLGNESSSLSRSLRRRCKRRMDSWE